MTAEEALLTFKEGFNCPDVALTETLALIQQDAKREAFIEAVNMCDEAKRTLINKTGCEAQGAILAKHGIIALATKQGITIILSSKSNERKVMKNE